MHANEVHLASLLSPRGTTITGGNCNHSQEAHEEGASQVREGEEEEEDWMVLSVHVKLKNEHVRHRART